MKKLLLGMLMLGSFSVLAETKVSVFPTVAAYAYFIAGNPDIKIISVNTTIDTHDACTHQGDSDWCPVTSTRQLVVTYEK